MTRIQFVMVVSLVLAAAGIGLAQMPGEVQRQVPVVEGVERPDSPTVDQAQGNAESDQRRLAPDAGAAQPPPPDVPDAPNQPAPQQD